MFFVSDKFSTFVSQEDSHFFHFDTERKLPLKNKECNKNTPKSQLCFGLKCGAESVSC